MNHDSQDGASSLWLHDHRIVILPRETFSRAHLPPRRCEVEGISRGDKLKGCLKCAAAYMF